jgi:glycosyltransferase involved in cell wall biosynthesis
MYGQLPADVRVYLFTYRRNNLLPRAVESLLKQTHKNWICELHNDDPNDLFPGQLVAQINDPRIRYIRHVKNIGAMGSFNLAFQPVAEQYISLLEDDNWWEPDFLSTMCSVMGQNPQVSVAWANMWFSREAADGTWHREGSIWPPSNVQDIQIFDLPDPRQVCGAIHSNGAMIVRVSEKTMFPTPQSLPFFAIEALRERGYPGPMLLVLRPIANFALTRATTRGETADQNMQILALLAQTFLENAELSDSLATQLWKVCRGSLGHKFRALLVGAIRSRRLVQMLKVARLRDLLLIVAWSLRHPVRFFRLFDAQRAYPEVYSFLSAASVARANERRAANFALNEFAT